MSEIRLIDAIALKEDFNARLEKAKNWKENALNKGDEEIVIRANATIDFICEVIMTINNTPTIAVNCKECPMYKNDCEHYEKGHKWQNIDRILPKDYSC